MLPGARIEPPASRGDVWRAMHDGVEVIGMIDGYFEHAPSPWHKEILEAIERGCVIVGSSSMGALRAAELDTFGMVGVGRIYELVADGKLSDADVAVSHGPSPDFRPTSVPNANVVVTLEHAVARSAMTADEAELLARASRSIFYPERIYPTVIAHAVSLGLPDDRATEIRGWLDEHAVDQKRDDALDLLARLDEERRTAPAATTAAFILARTIHHENMIAEEDALGRGTRVTAYSHPVLEEIQINASRFERTLASASIARHATQAARHQGVVPTQQLVDEASDALRHRLGLFDEAALVAWLGDNDLDWDGYADLIERRCLAEVAQRGRSGAVDEQSVLDELRWSGVYPMLRERTVAKSIALGESGLDESGASIANDDIDEVAWFVKHLNGGNSPAQLDPYARSVGFDDGAALVRAVRRERRFRELSSES